MFRPTPFLSNVHILVVDDDPKLRQFVRRGLEESGHACKTAADADAAMAELNTAGPGGFDAMLLDVLMPGRDGYEFCEELRRAGNDVPILFVTARRSVEDRVHGLRLGADDYLQKPFAFEELLARLEAIRRRRDSLPILRSGDLALHVADSIVERGGKRIELSRRELELLRALIEYRGEVASRAELLSAVWGMDFDPGTNVVDVQIAKLRRKLSGTGPDPIVSVKGVGYRLAREAAS